MVAPMGIETNNLSRLSENITFSFVEHYIKRESKSSGKEQMTKGFKYYCEDYVNAVKLFFDGTACTVKAKCYRSQRKNDSPHSMEVIFVNDDVDAAACSCVIGKSGSCGHVIALLYKLAYFKQLKITSVPADVAKTSLPQTWHKPRGEKLKGDKVDNITVQGYDKSQPQRATKGIKSTLYNPLPADFESDVENLIDKVQDLNILFSTVASASQTIDKVSTKFGKFRKGSVLGYQQKVASEYIVNLMDNIDFLQLPVKNNMQNNVSIALTERQLQKFDSIKVTEDESREIEEMTRLQSADPKWHKVRMDRITASNAGGIAKRRKDGLALAERLRSKRHIQTAAMKHGLESEVPASNHYSKAMNENVNIYPCGIVVSPYSPWLAASPDRKVYCPDRNPPFGLLEMKCPVADSISEVKYLHQVNGELKLKSTHDYFYQVQMQMACTGLQWCDFLVWLDNETHLETLHFDAEFWQNIKDKLDLFYYSFYLDEQ